MDPQPLDDALKLLDDPLRPPQAAPELPINPALQPQAEPAKPVAPELPPIPKPSPPPVVPPADAARPDVPGISVDDDATPTDEAYRRLLREAETREAMEWLNGMVPRQPGTSSPQALMPGQAQGETTAAEHGLQSGQETGELPTLLQVGRAIVRGIPEIPSALAQAPGEAAQAVLNLAEYISRQMPEFLQGGVQLFDKEGNLDIRVLSGEERVQKLQSGEVKPLELPEVFPEPETTVGQLTKALGQFLVGFGAVGRAFSALNVPKAASTTGMITQDLAKAFVTDFAAFDGIEGNLFNLLELYPPLKGPVTEYLAASPDNTEVENRLKNAVAGLGLGAVFSSMLLALRSLREARRLKELTGAPTYAEAAEKLVRDMQSGAVKPEISTMEGFLGAPDDPLVAWASSLPKTEFPVPDDVVAKGIEGSARDAERLGFAPEGQPRKTDAAPAAEPSLSASPEPAAATPAPRAAEASPPPPDPITAAVREAVEPILPPEVKVQVVDRIEAPRTTAFARSINDALRTGDERVLIRDLYDEMQKRGYTGDYATFQQDLQRAARAGQIELERYDLAPPGDPALRARIEASRTPFGRDERHYVVRRGDLFETSEKYAIIRQGGNGDGRSVRSAADQGPETHGKPVPDPIGDGPIPNRIAGPDMGEGAARREQKPTRPFSVAGLADGLRPVVRYVDPPNSALKRREYAIYDAKDNRVAYMLVRPATRNRIFVYDVYAPGMGKMLYDAVELDMGGRIMPSGTITERAYRFWLKRDADAVKWHQRSLTPQGEVEYVSPRELLLRIQDDVATDSDLALWRNLPEEARRAAEDPDALFALAGPKALTADEDNLVRAQAMQKRGEKVEKIWQETGWYQGFDGKWRFEIDDSDASLTPGFLKQLDEAKEKQKQWPYSRPDIYTTLGEMLNHPHLFRAYPQFRAIPVSVSESSILSSSAGSFSGRTRAIEIRGSHPEEITDTVLHEVQHLIQEEEIFAVGGNPTILEKANEKALFEVTRQIEEIENSRSRIGHNSLPFLRELKQALEDTHERLQNYASVLTYSEVQKASYRAIAGEVEARNVEGRRKLPAEEKRARSPESTQDTPREHMIYAGEPASVTFQNEIDIIRAIHRAYDEVEARTPFAVANPRYRALPESHDSHKLGYHSASVIPEGYQSNVNNHFYFSRKDLTEQALENGAGPMLKAMVSARAYQVERLAAAQKEFLALDAERKANPKKFSSKNAENIDYSFLYDRAQRNVRDIQTEIEEYSKVIRVFERAIEIGGGKVGPKPGFITRALDRANMLREVEVTFDKEALRRAQERLRDRIRSMFSEETGDEFHSKYGYYSDFERDGWDVLYLGNRAKHDGSRLSEAAKEIEKRFPKEVAEWRRLQGEKYYIELKDHIKTISAKMFSLRAYHGSPHDFDRFDMSKVGIGEGNQAYGFGLYFAEEKAVADKYRVELSTRSDVGHSVDGKPYDASNPDHIASRYLFQAGSRDEAVAQLRAALGKTTGIAASRIARAIEALESGRKLPEYTGVGRGRLYEVEIDVDDKSILDYDRPIGEQDLPVPALAGLLERSQADVRQMTGKVFQDELRKKIIAADPRKADRKTDVERTLSEQFLAAGVKGIRYLDRESRVTGEGTRNLVIFDDSLIKIVAKDGKPVSAQERAVVLAQSQTDQFALSRFYSPAIRAVETATPAKASAKDWLAILSKYPGVKQEELDWIGVKDWLSEQKGSVSKEDMLAFMRSHQVELEDRVLGSGVADFARSRLGPDDILVEGRFTPNDLLIEVSRMAFDPVGVARHESIHALRALGLFTDQEWQTLAHTARKERWTETTGVEERYRGVYGASADADDKLLEEAIAWKFKEWMQGKGTLDAQTVTLFERIRQFLARLANALRGQGFQTAEDVFERVRSGEIKGRRASIPVPDDPRLSAAPRAPDATAAAAPHLLPIETPRGTLYVNWARIDSTDGLKQVLADAAYAYQDDILAAQGGVKTHAMTRASADQINAWNVLLGERGNPLPDAAETLALRDLYVASGQKLREVAQQVIASPTVERQFALRKMMAVHQAIQAQVFGIRTAQAQALNQWRIAARGERERMRAMEQILREHGGNQVTLDIAAKLDALAKSGNQAAIDKFVRKSALSSTLDAVREYYMGALLSGPKTHLVNALSNTSVVLLSMAERAVAGQLSHILSPVDGVRVGEATAMMWGIRQSLKEAFILAGKTFRTGQQGQYSGIIEGPRLGALSSEALSTTTNPVFNRLMSRQPLGRAIDMLGTIVRIPGRALAASDEFFKTINYRAEIWAQAFRQAMQEIDRGRLPPERFKERMVELVEEAPEQLRLKALDMAAYNTFTNDPGPFVNSVMRVRDHLGPLGWLILPFVRTPANILAYTFERTPLAPLSARIRADIAAGGERQALALARIGLGTMIMGVAYEMALDGTITGSGPQKPRERQALLRTGWQPYSIRVPDGRSEDGTPKYRYYAFNRLDPLGFTLGIAADFGEYMLNADETSLDPDWEEIWAAAVASAADNVLDKSYLRSFSTLIAAINDHDIRAERFIVDTLGAFVPVVVKDVAQFQDPHAKYIANTMDKLKSRLPGYSKDVPNRVDLWGRDISFRSGLGTAYDMVSPIYSRQHKPEPADQELLRLKLYPIPMNAVQIKRSDMSKSDSRHVSLRNMPQALRRYHILSGGTPANQLPWEHLNRSQRRILSLAGSRTPLEFLNDVVTGKDKSAVDDGKPYAELTDEERRDWLQSVFSAWRAAAKPVLLKEFPRIQELRDRMQER